MSLPLSPMPYQPLEVKDFSGGITDSYLGAAINRYEKADNLLIDRYSGQAKLKLSAGSKLYVTGNEFPTLNERQIPGGLRVAFLRQLYSNGIGRLIAFAGSKIFNTSGGTWVETLGPTGAQLLLNSTDLGGVSVGEHDGQLYVANNLGLVTHLYLDSLPQLKARTAGLPVVTTFTGSGAAGTGKYLYKVIYSYAYIVGGKTYTIKGQATQTLVTAAAPNTSAITLSMTPVYANAGGFNFDTGSAQFVKEIYRTTESGQNFYYLGFVSNATTAYVDTLIDSALTQREPLYTEGGIPENARPPRCKIVHIIDGTAYYVNVRETRADDTSLGLNPKRFYQSVPGVPMAVPDTFFEEVTDDITGFSSVKSIPVLMCNSGNVYRLEGQITETGAGAIDKVLISTVAGCYAQNSIVQTESGIFWAGIGGFYFSDGFRVIKISHGIDKTYASYTDNDTQRSRINGAFDPIENRIWWGVQGLGDGDCESVVVLDLNSPISEDMAFTTLSGQSLFYASALSYSRTGPNGASNYRAMLRGDVNGYVFSHLDSLRTDLRVDLGVDAPLWGKDTILYAYASPAYDFGSAYERKWVANMSLLLRNDSNLSVDIGSINDDKKIAAYLKPIRYRGNVTWGDSQLIWGDPDLVWNRGGVINEARKFPSRGLRCQYKQITLSNANVGLFDSDSVGLIAVDGTLNTVTKTGSSWPLDLIGYTMSFSSDGYEREFKILAQSSLTLTLEDTSNLLPTSAAAEWVIRGRPKGEGFFLISYTVQYAYLGRTQTPFNSSATGEVGS